MPAFLFNMIIVFAFALITINMAVLGHLTKLGYIRIAALAAGVATVISYFMVSSPNVYFFAAFGVVITQIIPSLIGLSKEPKNA